MVVAFMHRAVAGNGGALSIWANLYLVLQIKVFQIIYNQIAFRLSYWENHKYHADFYNSHLWKQVFFQFVNYYVPFFYLVMRQRVSKEGCPEAGCLAALQNALNTTLAILGAARLAQVLFIHALTNYRLHAEVASAGHGRKESLWADASPHHSGRNTNRSNDSDALDRFATTSELGTQQMRHKHSWLEKQSKYPGFQILEQIEVMLELVLALGYVLIFGAVAFGTVLFCFLVFCIQLRASAYLLTSNARRPLPRKSIGIGAYRDVVDALMKIGVLFEGFLIVTFDQSFAASEPITKLMGIVIFWLVCAFCWFIVDLICPSPDHETILLEKRRKYTIKKFMRKTGHLISSNRDNTTWERDEIKVLTDDEITKIPHFDGTPVIRQEG